MKFLSDILAKAGLVVDGVVQLNNTATGQTPASGDNSTKLATTAFVKNQNYLTGNQTITLSGDATGSGTTSIAVTLANSGVTAGTYGNASNIPTITVDAKGRVTSITTTAVSIVTTLAGLSDVQLSAQLIDKQVLQYNAATGKWVNASANIDPATTSTLGTIIVGAGLSVTAQGVLSVNGTGSARSVETFTATSGQTTFTVAQSYTVGLVDVYVNGVRLSSASYTASNGTTIVLADAAVAGDIIDIVKYTPLSGLAFTSDNVPEGTVNLYFTDARARAAISLTTTGTSGAATYNSSTGVLNIPNYQGLVPAGGVAGDILAKVSGTNYDVAWIPNYTSQVQHYVKLGESMTAGTPVYVSGGTGQSGTNMIVSKASNTTEATSSKTMGLIATGGVTNDIVFVVTEGLLAGLDTSAAQIADPVWLGPNGTLLFGLANKPVAPAHLVYLGVVTRVQQNNGEIFVKVQNGYEIDELHDVLITSLADKHILYRDAATGLWKNASISTVLGYTPANASGTAGQVAYYSGSTTLTGSNSFFWDSANIRLGIGTTLPTRGLDIESALGTSVGIQLNSTATGGRSYSFFSTNDASSLGGGRFGIYDDTAQASRIVLDSVGSVGINTNTPGHRLDVNGTGRFVNRLTVDADIYFTNYSSTGIVITGPNVVYPLITIGSNNTASGNTNILIGQSNQGTGGAFVIGASNVSNSNGGVVIGQLNQANTSGQHTILIGSSNTTSHASTIFTGTFAIGNNNVLAHQASSIMGSNQTTTATNQLIFAATQSNVNSAGYNDIYFGTGPRSKNTNLLGSNITINGSGAGAGSDLSGGNVTIAGGKGTGTGTPGDVVIATASTTTSGSTLQSLTNRWWIKSTTGQMANVANPNAAAVFQLDSTTRGFLPPRMTAAQRGAISSPPVGLVVYQTDGTEGLWAYTASGWKALALVN